VYELIHRYKNKEMIYIILLTMLAIAVKLRYFFKLLLSEAGFPESDDSKWYLDYAHAMMADFNIGMHMNDLMYIGYNLLLTLLLALFKSTTAVILIQTITSGLAVIFVYKIARMLFNVRTAVIASIFYSFSWNITIWSMYILSDSFFITLLIMCVYFLLKYKETGKRSYQALFVATSVYLFFFRPTGIVTLAFMLLYIPFMMDKQTVLHLLKKYRLAIGGVLAVAAGAFVYVVVSPAFYPLFESMEENAKMVLYNIYAPGWIYDRPSAYDHQYKVDYTINIANSLILSFFVNNAEHIAVLYAKRSLAFLGYWVWKIDLTGITGILKFGWYALQTVLFAIGTYAAIKHRQFRKASVLWLVILAVFVFCVFFFIDAMYRYKAPALPFIIIVAGYGASVLVETALTVFNKVKHSRVKAKIKA